MAAISFNNGHTFLAAEEVEDGCLRRYWDEITDQMDDEIREAVHNEIAPCTEREFLTAYLNRTNENIVIG